MLIYSNLEKSGKALGTRLLQCWTLRDREIRYTEERTFFAREISQQNWETSSEHFLQKDFMQFQGVMEISTSQFTPPISHPQRMANPSRNDEIVYLGVGDGGCSSRLLETCPNFLGLRALKVDRYLVHCTTVLKQDSENLYLEHLVLYI